MAFGNPYGDSWNEYELGTAIARIAELGIRSISLADTVGMADATLIQQVVTTAMKSGSACEIGVHLHSTPADAIGRFSPLTTPVAEDLTPRWRTRRLPVRPKCTRWKYPDRKRDRGVEATRRRSAAQDR